MNGICKLLQEFSMINNSPYSLSDMPPKKSGRIYTENNSAQYRKNDSLDNSQSFTQSGTRNHNNNGMGLMMKKSSINMEDQSTSFRPPIYPGVKNDFNHYLPSPKNISSNSNISNFSNMSSQRNSLNYRIDQKQLSSTQPQSSSVYSLELKDIQEKIQMLQFQIKNNEKKINQLQKNCGSSFFLPNNSAVNIEQPISNTNFEVYSGMLTRFQAQAKEEFIDIKQNISKIREEIKNLSYNNHKESRDHTEAHTIQQMMKTQEFQISQKFHKDLQKSKVQLEEKINLNHEFLTSVIGRLQRQIHSNANQYPTYKSSAIRCSGSAILLRFVECFKVRKNTSANKMGEIKIILTDNTYYIDNQGYLLDKQQHYLVDIKGNQVRLQERHVKLLRDQRVLM